MLTMKNGEYSTAEFAEFLKVSRQTLNKKARAKVLTPKKRGYWNYYDRSHLSNPWVKEQLQALEEDHKTQTLHAVPKPTPEEKPSTKPLKPKKLKKVTTLEGLKKIPIGFLAEYIPPLEGLDEDGRKIWDAVLPVLIERGDFHSGDIMTLRNYCSSGSLIARMERELAMSDLVNYAGKVNPLVSAINSSKTIYRGFATALHLTPNSRKNLKPGVRVWDYKLWIIAPT